MITLTEEAGAKLKEILAQKAAEAGVETGLRVFVREGGCSGFSYGMKPETAPTENDRISMQHGVKVIIDPVSAMYLQGATIDYVENLMGGGFTIQNPNAVQTCGCGQSFRTDRESGRPQPCDDDEDAAQ